MAEKHKSQAQKAASGNQKGKITPNKTPSASTKAAKNGGKQALPEIGRAHV